MFKSILNDIKLAWYRNTLYKLIIINVGVFLVVNLVKLAFAIAGAGDISPLFDHALEWFMISSDLVRDLLFPWTWITYMFLHEGLFHVFINMLYLFYFGRILGDLGGDKRVLPTYLLSGLGGALAFIVFANVLPNWPGMGSGLMLGASASTMGILWAAAVLSPDYDLHLILIGRIKLKWIAVALTLLDMVTLTTYDNTGGHIAHIGGALIGGLIMWRLKAGVDWTLPVSNVLDRLATMFDRERKSPPKSPLKVVHRQSRHKSKKTSSADSFMSRQERIDQILDKISKSGFDSLTKEEQEFLENASDR